MLDKYLRQERLFYKIAVHGVLHIRVQPYRSVSISKQHEERTVSYWSIAKRVVDPELESYETHALQELKRAARLKQLENFIVMDSVSGRMRDFTILWGLLALAVTKKDYITILLERPKVIVQRCSL